MSVPDYFRRNAIAISQAISGLDEEHLETLLGDTCIGVTIGPDASGDEGRAMVDLLVRLLARLYPSIVISAEGASGLGEEVNALAQRINPRIELSGQPTIEVVVGTAEPEWSNARSIFSGSSGWNARLSTLEQQECGGTNNPFGAGLAACLAAADVFRQVFLSTSKLEGEVELGIPNMGDLASENGNLTGNVGSIVLAGAGAIGNGAAWALTRTAVEGSIEIVDHEAVDLGNLQRYVLTERQDEERPKAQFVAEQFEGKFNAIAHEFTLGEFLQQRNHRVDNLLLALDSAKDRCAAQASLPRQIANAWTQPGDLGASSHDFLKGACVNCLYLTNSEQKNEDQIIADSFGVSDRLMQVRTLLHNGLGAPRDLLEAIANAREIPYERLRPFEDRSVRTLYTEGFCGGAVIPLGELGEPTNEVHVPLAHQSAMAGLMLAAIGVRIGLGLRTGSVVSQYDVLKPQEQFQTYPAAKDPRGTCICQDKDFTTVYRRKYSL